MSTWEKDYGQIIKDVRRSVIDHHISERPSRSFHFQTPSKGGMYAFALTWTPGSMVLTGDLGEMQVTHWHAMQSAVKSFDWIAGGHQDYLLGKSDAKKVYDRDATWETIKSYLDDEIKDIARAYRDECYEAKELCTHKHEWAFRSPDIRDYERDFDYLSRLNDEFGWGHKHDLFTSSGRRGIRAEIKEYIMDHAEDEVGRGLYNAGFEEYYGSKKWDHSAISQITAMQHGARMAHKFLCQELDLKEAQRVADASKAWFASGHPVSGAVWEEFRKVMGENAGKPV